MTVVRRALVLDDHTHIRSSVATCLERMGFDEVVELHSLAATRTYLAAHESPAVIVLDLRLPDGLSTELMPLLNDRGIPVVVFSAADDAYSVRTAFAGGAIAFVLKSADVASLTAAISAAIAGEHLVTDDVAELLVHGVRLASAHAAPELRQREIDVLRLASQGLSNAEIGKQLMITTLAVKGQFATVGRKLGVSSRAGMVAIAMRANVID